MAMVLNTGIGGLWRHKGLRWVLALLVAVPLLYVVRHKIAPVPVRPTLVKGVALPYRTIAKPGAPQELYAYELHSRRVPQEYDREYCAVVRAVDPATDDYKAYCKSVIADIVQYAGTAKLAIHVYDSNEAYELYEVKYLQRLQSLSSDEATLVGAHHIASYVGDWVNVDWDDSHRLKFYEDAQNGLAETEEYRP